VSLNGHLSFLAIVEILQGHLELKGSGLDLLGALLSLATTATHAKEIEDVVETRSLGAIS
jgi:hypothetical protein